MKLCKKIFNHRLLLATCNLLFMASGIGILVAGFSVLCDGPRILLSRLIISSLDNSPLTELSQPFFFYVSLGTILMGLVATIAAALGVWASCVNRYCILSIYFLIVITLLLFEFAICLMISLWPQCLGLTLNVTAMVKTLQGYYGIPGEEQFTAAMDLAQVKFECCGINTSINYDTSLWKLQGLGKKELTVPLTCCHLENKSDKWAYLDPVPVNTTLCQALLEHDYEKHRYVDSCVEKIEQWYREQYLYFLGAGVILALIEFAVILSIILSCTRIPKKPKRKTLEEIEVHHEPISLSNIYQENFPTSLPEIREVFVQPQNIHKKKHYAPYKPSTHNNYEVSRSYLV